MAYSQVPLNIWMQVHQYEPTSVAGTWLLKADECAFMVWQVTFDKFARAIHERCNSRDFARSVDFQKGDDLLFEVLLVPVSLNVLGLYCAVISWTSVLDDLVMFAALDRLAFGHMDLQDFEVC